MGRDLEVARFPPDVSSNSWASHETQERHFFMRNEALSLAMWSPSAAL